ncbi:hypothetical protein [Mycobacteroides abscessus]|uniref:hypothetical protein n=1 Tax=Mycobacteroides abscessus TaxID=36809 RepID=UPI0007F95A01|nr:hypothetical protein [Mycobacteroides abscessus]ANO12759.1 hypothetical protein BAB77_01860 [Mycobacteroides abscessus]ARQ63011.1 hypothetical protein CAK77_02040 [Mycobacteroides abscessus subsp. massiliense]MBE5447576.1 hypothetical protein [Mycobacteroides abscessus]MBE5514197.1 hypothetical protein [Mycobacteroides abscessus]MBN7511818.1 hypothetical protein [Mycobacteroides abscessus subsp. massiliense]
MRSLDDLIADIDQLEADDELRPLPGESEAEFKARMLSEFDELNAAEDTGALTIAPWDAWRWTPAAEPEPTPAAAPTYLIDPEDIHTIMPRGGPLTVSIGGRRLGTLNPAAA